MLNFSARFMIVLFMAMFAMNNNAFAAIKLNKLSTKKFTPLYNPIESSLVIDSSTGKILHSMNATKPIYPASLTKVATLYLVFDALNKGKITLNQRFKISRNATKAKPCKLYLNAGETISTQELISALIVRSANDAAIVAAEAIAGSEQKFAELMNSKSKQLGMFNTKFMNATGWHHPNQKTTLLDLAKLTIAIKRDFPQYYAYFKQTSFKYKGNTIRGHNKLTEKYPGAEGLKTGYTCASGSNLITTATRGNKSLVGIVTGSRSTKERDIKMAGLLDKHFALSGVKLSKTNIYPINVKSKKITTSKKLKVRKKIKSKQLASAK